MVIAVHISSHSDAEGTGRLQKLNSVSQAPDGETEMRVLLEECIASRQSVERFFVALWSARAVSRCFCATGYVSAAH